MRGATYFVFFSNRVAVSREADLLEEVWMTNKIKSVDGLSASGHAARPPYL
jgi:hypothetical protein